MSQIRYKFVNSLEGSAIVFDGVSLTLEMLKRAIVTQERLTASGMDLVVTDTAGTPYAPGATILKNTSVLVKQKAPAAKTVYVSSGSAIPGLGSVALSGADPRLAQNPCVTLHCGSESRWLASPR